MQGPLPNATLAAILGTLGCSHLPPETPPSTLDSSLSPSSADECKHKHPASGRSVRAPSSEGGCEVVRNRVQLFHEVCWRAPELQRWRAPRRFKQHCPSETRPKMAAPMTIPSSHSARHLCPADNNDQLYRLVATLLRRIQSEKKRPAGFIAPATFRVAPPTLSHRSHPVRCDPPTLLQ